MQKGAMKGGEVKTKRAIIHIGQEGNQPRIYWAYCGCRGYIVYPWEKAKDMTPLCKRCLRVMEAEKKRREGVGVTEMNGNSE